MPILDVEVVAGGAGLPSPTALADAAAAVFASTRGRTWVRLRRLPEEDYGENGRADFAAWPVFVTVWLADPLDDPAAAAKRLSAAIGGVLGRPTNKVHVLFEPPCRGRIAFGGVLVE